MDRTSCPLRVIACPRSPHNEKLITTLTILLGSAVDAAHRAHVRVARPDEATRTNCPADWLCIVIDATCPPEARTQIYLLADIFRQGVVFQQA